MRKIDELILKKKQMLVKLAVLEIAINEIQSSCEHEFRIVYSTMLYDIEECKKCRYERDIF